MFRNLGSFLDSLDNVAKETFEEPQISATALRSKKKEEFEQLSNTNSNPLVSNYVEDNDSKDYLVYNKHMYRQYININNVFNGRIYILI